MIDPRVQRTVTTAQVEEAQRRVLYCGDLCQRQPATSRLCAHLGPVRTSGVARMLCMYNSVRYFSRTSALPNALQRSCQCLGVLED
jgi:hypothetical protein